ncbi:MAG: RNA pseudouridine synthase [Rhodobacteraceae bacterium]|nr:RNA pseudouridine synthase [Paracoccaceae bacterium]
MNTEFSYRPPQVPLAILYQDESIVLIDKPSGLLSVPGKAAEHRDCLESRVRLAFPASLLVHRLDMDTSGVMVFALDRAAQRHLGLQFERRRVEKTYIADVWGQPEAGSGEIDLPLIADWPNRPLQKICSATGRSALTRWQVVARQGDVARLRLSPVTGRSHQLRVHLAAIGHPILGDRFYADGAALAASARLRLHAESLTFQHPVGGKRQRFECLCPF